MFEEFNLYMQTMGLAENTIKNYLCTMRGFHRFVRKNLKKITLDDVDRFIRHLKKDKGYKNTTINLKINGIKKYYKFLERKGELNEQSKRIFLVKDLPTTKIQRVIIIEDEVKELLSSDLNKRQKCVLAVLFQTGIRISELLNLNRDSFTLKQDYVVVDIMNTKNKRDRRVFMNYDYYSYVEDYINSSKGDALITRENGERLKTRQLSYIVESLSESLDKRLTPHDYRASCFTHLYRKGVDIYTISKIAGHSSIEITESYINEDEEDLSKALEAFK